MQPHITMWTYLWDLVDLGIEPTLRSMKDDLGLTALSVATHYHSVDHLRPRANKAFHYQSDSALYFEPDADIWRDVAMKHVVSPIAKQNPLADVSAAAQDVGLDLVSWTICCHSSVLGNAYPHAAQHNALGIPQTESLCPACDDTRAFLTALTTDVARNYGVKWLELESCHYALGRHYHRHEKIAFDLTPLTNFLLGICFCGSCRGRARRANIDVDSLQQAFATALKAMFETGDPPTDSVDEFIARTPGLSDYIAMRTEVVTSLLRDMQDSADAPLSPIVWSGVNDTGVDGKAIADLTGNITICAYHTDVADTQRAIEQGIAHTGDAAKLRVGYHTYPPIVPTRQVLLDNVAASLDMGVRAFTFYHHGIAPQRSLDWVADAAEMIHDRC